jgi:two-component system, chemotaxis family, sensor kinase CheA
MAITPEDLASLNWSDFSPPNLMAISEKLNTLEKVCTEKGLDFPEAYAGADEIFEGIMFETFSAPKLLPLYKVYANGISGSFQQNILEQLLAPILAAIQKAPQNISKNEKDDEGSTNIQLQDANEKLDLVSFIQEALEQLSHLENQLPELKDHRTDGTFLNGLFRRIHTIKGASGFFGLTQLTHISHQLENVMDRARNGNIDIDDEVVTLLVKGGEWLKNHLNEILVLLEDAQLPCKISVPKGYSDPVNYGCMAIIARPKNDVKMQATVADKGEAVQSTIQISQDYLDEFIKNVGDLLNLAHIFKHSESRLAMSSLSREEIHRFKENFFALEEKTDGLQKRLMQLRRVKIKQLLDKVPKIIFRLTQIVSKKVKVEIKGEHIEIDRSMLNVLEDPMVHILRNSLDHGIETPEERLRLGKSEEGLFRITVSSSQNLVHICIEDDGKGIDGEAVAKRAVEKGVITQAQFDQMSLQQKQELIFRPSFSTRDVATEISGRGVGMDVVKSKIVEAGGAIQLRSTLGKGTQLMMSLPIAATLSTRSILRVRCGEFWFGLGMDEIECIACHSRKDAPLVKSGSMELFSYRGTNIPVINLNKIFGLPLGHKEFRSFIVVHELEHGIAVEVDEFSEFETHVMQNFLEGHLDKTPFEGASVMGDGSICQLIAFDKIMKLAKLQKIERVLALPEVVKNVKKEPYGLLIIKPSLSDLRLSLDMDWVARIENFDPTQLKTIKKQRVYKCSMGLLQYYECCDFSLGQPVDNPNDIFRIVVLDLGLRRIALGVHQVIDMYTGSIQYLGSLNIPGLIDSWSHEDHLVGVVDMNTITRAVKPKEEKLLLAVNA